MYIQTIKLFPGNFRIRVINIIGVNTCTHFKHRANTIGPANQMDKHDNGINCICSEFSCYGTKFIR